LCALTDQFFPRLQEPILAVAPRIVSCAAVDRNGYLPTHNRKVSGCHGREAGCRTRRLVNDRVGLGAGRITAPFLLQMYRRYRSGGTFDDERLVRAHFCQRTASGRIAAGLCVFNAKKNRRASDDGGGKARV